jgi:hypothetical protein
MIRLDAGKAEPHTPHSARLVIEVGQTHDAAPESVTCCATATIGPVGSDLLPSIQPPSQGVCDKEGSRLLIFNLLVSAEG